MEKILAWNNEGYFEYLGKDELFDCSTQYFSGTGYNNQPSKKTEEKHERFCWIESIEKAEAAEKKRIAEEKKRMEAARKSRYYHHRSEKYNSYFYDEDIYSESLSESYNLIAYGKSSNYLGKNDYCYRECGRYGSSVLCDDYDN